MVPSGQPNPMGPGQQVGASLLRTSSSLLGGGAAGVGGGQPGMGMGMGGVGAGGVLPSQSPFSSLVSGRAQYGGGGGNGLLAGASNVASLLSRQHSMFGIVRYAIGSQDEALVETTVEVLPRLCQIKYASGTLEELLYVDMPRESQNSSGQIVLDYTKAIQESVFEQLRVVREGHLRIVFNQDLKIASWEFCARRHEELIPRRSIIPQVSQLGAVVQKYQSSVQNSASLSSQDMQNNSSKTAPLCFGAEAVPNGYLQNRFRAGAEAVLKSVWFVACARQLAKALEVPLVNDLGYTKRYVRCLQVLTISYLPDNHFFCLNDDTQIAEVVNCMKDLIDHSRQTGSGPIAPSSSSVVGLLQGSVNCRQEHPTSSGNGLYNGGNNASVAKANSTNSMQSNPQASFPSPTPSASNGNMMLAPQHSSQMNSPTMSSNLPPMQTPASRPQDPESNESQSSVQRILQEMMMQSQMNGVGPVGGDMKRANTITPGLNGVNSLVGNPMANNSGINGMGFGAMGGIGQSMRTVMGNNVMAMNGRTGMNHSAHDLMQLSHQQQQRDIGNQLLGGLRTANSFNNIQYDWKSSQ
ncbi:Transcriptional corepressor SEUSS [Dichanthelium oligosanthes]|uniref:Transcriptional corepressor SEUSS n=1 Tax=Dichanthelium oligosanthes TaxID=888268 RepID=A0A1E5VN36_9POAL|nr:Transcriptional corepressor SEUSS [Dichanthelium oligosanthes]